MKSILSIFFVILLLIPCCCNSEKSEWKSMNWESGVNLTEIISKKGVTELSGLHWNPVTKRLYVIGDNGRLYVLEMDKSGKTFSLIAQNDNLGTPEGIMQVNYNQDEFYTIDEKNYEIRRYIHNTDFSDITLENNWDLRSSPGLMPDTGNNGPEGIEFVPDVYLKNIGFISSETNEKYTSTKGMGGLIFIAHQKKGYVWVFDINPKTSEDYVFVGRYKTKENESCDLEFDRSTGLMYILHNTGKNSLEVTDLSTELKSGKTGFVTLKEYNIPNPNDGNINIEGFAVTPKFAGSKDVSVWFCRDVDKSEKHSRKKDCLRWFTGFESKGKLFENRSK